MSDRVITRLIFRSLNMICQNCVMRRCTESILSKFAPPIRTRHYLATHPWCIALYKVVVLTDCTPHAVRERRQHHGVCRWPESVWEKSNFSFSQKTETPIVPKPAPPICKNHSVARQNHFVNFSLVFWAYSFGASLKKLLHS